MANIVIEAVSAKNKFKVTSNAVDTGWTTCFFWPEDIFHVHLETDCIELRWQNGTLWEMSFDGKNGTWNVDTVTTTTITSNAQLADLLSNIRG